MAMAMKMGMGRLLVSVHEAIFVLWSRCLARIPLPRLQPPPLGRPLGDVLILRLTGSRASRQPATANWQLAAVNRQPPLMEIQMSTTLIMGVAHTYISFILELEWSAYGSSSACRWRFVRTAPNCLLDAINSRPRRGGGGVGSDRIGNRSRVSESKPHR